MKDMNSKHKKIWQLGLLAVVIMFASCDDATISPSSTVTTEEIAIEDFSSISVSDAFDVEVFYSDEQYVLIESNENLHEFIEAYQKEGELVIGVEGGIDISGRTILKARVYTNNPIGYISVRGASRLTATDVIYKEDVTFDLTGASFLRTQIATENIIANIQGASNLELRGSATSIQLEIGGSSRMQDADMEVSMADVKLSGASSAEIVITDEIRLNASGASVLRYAGDARIKTIDLTSGSTIEKIN